MSDGGPGRASLGVKVWKASQKWSVRRSAVRTIAWLGLCGFIGGRGATIGAQLHNKFFAIIANAHILLCKLESAFKTRIEAKLCFATCAKTGRASILVKNWARAAL